MRTVRLPDLVIPIGLDDSNYLYANVHFGDAESVSIYAPEGPWPSGTVGIEISWIDNPGQFDWKLLGSDDQTAGDLGVRMTPGAVRTFPVCFKSLRLHGFGETFVRTFQVTKKIRHP